MAGILTVIAPMLKSFALFLAIMVALPAGALTFRAEGPTVLVNEYPVFTLKATLDGLSPETRSQRIVETLRTQGLPGELSLFSGTRGLWIRSGAVNVVRITAPEAAAHNVAIRDLALQWKNRIEFAMQLPPLQASNSVITMGAGETTLGRVYGREALGAQYESSDPETLTVEKVAGGARIRALRAGSAEVIVTSANSRIRLVVKALPVAVVWPDRIEAEVQGDPATPDVVEAAILAAIREAAQLVEGATLEVFDLASPSIPRGQTVTVTCRVRVRSTTAREFDGPIRVRVRNPVKAALREQELWYSNYPERVSDFGPLFGSKLERSERVRLLYHHQNATPQPMMVKVLVYNPSFLPAQIQRIGGDGAPHTDPVRTGLDAADQFLRSWLDQSSQVITIPPRTAVPLAVRRLASEQVISGLASLALLPGGPPEVLIRTEAATTTAIEATWLEAARSATPWEVAAPVAAFRFPTDEPISPHVYAAPFRDLSADFQVGGRFAFVRIGQEPIASVDASRVLEGNFGVLYTVDTRLANPTPRTTDIEIAFEASAGYSGSLFAVDGVVRPSNLLQSKQEFQLKRVRLAPGEVRNVRIQTIPLSGSSYPATLVVRPFDRQASSAMIQSPSVR